MGTINQYLFILFIDILPIYPRAVLAMGDIKEREEELFI